MKPKPPKSKTVKGIKYTTSGIGYRSRKIALDKAQKLRHGGYRARVETFSSSSGDWFVVYLNDPREYDK